ncbi:hypothetical protein NQZ68_029344 [Dissostichus eleginoides]|nr:hypothetical protein NQZ68_029344 [Dissostichus eleginoides]
MAGTGQSNLHHCGLSASCSLGRRVHTGGLLHNVCQRLSRGGGAGENSGKSTGGGRVQICGPAPRQHGVSGSPTPSASWETGRRSHPRWNVMFGMYAPWNVGEVTVEWDVTSAMLAVTGALSKCFLCVHDYTVRSYTLYPLIAVDRVTDNTGLMEGLQRMGDSVSAVRQDGAVPSERGTERPVEGGGWCFQTERAGARAKGGKVAIFSGSCEQKSPTIVHSLPPALPRPNFL